MGNQDNQNKDTKQNPPINTSTQNTNQPKPGLSWSNVQNSSTNNTSSGNATPKSTIDASGSDSTGRTIGIIVGIIVVFVLVAWGIASFNKQSSPSTTSTATSTDMAMDTQDTATDTTPNTNGSANSTVIPAPPAQVAAAGSAAFTVQSPQGAGSEVAVGGITVAAPTWIIVYESKDGTTAGNILGAGLFFPGDTTGNIELLRPTTAGATYLVGAAVDSGDKVFVKADEKYVTNASGAVALQKFQTQ